MAQRQVLELRDIGRRRRREEEEDGWGVGGDVRHLLGDPIDDGNATRGTQGKPLSLSMRRKSIGSVAAASTKPSCISVKEQRSIFSGRRPRFGGKYATG